MSPDKLREDFVQKLANIQNKEQLFVLEKEFLGRKSGLITLAFKEIPNLSVEEKKEFGPKINSLKNFVEREISGKRKNIEKESVFDKGLPPISPKIGHKHPLTKSKEIFERIFLSMGFDILEGNEVESIWYQFDALNFKKDHPARDVQDTFYVKGESVLRSHTSNMQVRYYKDHKPPFQAIVLGKVFRNEATDPTHEHTFYQMEGFAVAEKGIVTVASLKYTLSKTLSLAFGKEVKTRFRPSFFPFVEPGFEVDFSCTFCDGGGCRICKKTGWIEWLGAGMIHPNTLKAGDIDPEKYSGWAFGGGLERFAMLKFGVRDARYFHSGDLRFLRQEGV